MVPYVLGNGYESGTVWFTTDPKLPQGSANEGWIEITFSVATTMNRIRVGMLWKSGVTNGAEFYINTMELYEYNGAHGNAVFAQTGYTYQYHLKDHLGNVRMTFTTKDEVDSARATLETNEDASGFLNYDAARLVYGQLFDHTNGNSPGYSQRLSGTANEKVGLARSFSVMPGDTISAEVYAKYFDVPNDPQTLPLVLQTLLTNLGAPGSSGGAVVDGLGHAAGGTIPIPITGAGAIGDENSTAPNAYLAYIFINRNFDLTSAKYLWTPITVAAREDGLADGNDHEYLTLTAQVTEPGYVYVYLRNDEAGSEVYFDDFKVEHVKSPVIESSDYYPFGLVFNNYQRENSLSNQIKFQ